MCLRMIFYTGNILGICTYLSDYIRSRLELWALSFFKLFKDTSYHRTSTCQSDDDGNCSQTVRHTVKSRKLTENVPIWEGNLLETPTVWIPACPWRRSKHWWTQLPRQLCKDYTSGLLGDCTFTHREMDLPGDTGNDHSASHLAQRVGKTHTRKLLCSFTES